MRCWPLTKSSSSSALRAVEADLAAGSHRQAVQRLEQLGRRQVKTLAVRQLREVAERLEAASQLARRGKFADADAQLAFAEQLRPELEVVGRRRDEYRRQREKCRALDSQLHRAMIARRWSDVLAAAEAILVEVPEHSIATAARKRAWAAAAVRRDSKASTAPGLHEVEQQTTPFGVGASAASPSDELSVGEGRLSVPERLKVVGGPRRRRPARRSPVPAEPVMGGRGRRFLGVLQERTGVGSGGRRRGGRADPGRHLAAARPDSPPVGGVRVGAHPDRQGQRQGSRLARAAARRRPTPPGKRPPAVYPTPRTQRHGPLGHPQPSPDSADCRRRVVDGRVVCVGAVSRRNHVHCPDWEGDVVLFRKDSQLHCRALEPIEVDGVRRDGAAALRPDSQVVGQIFRSSWSLSDPSGCRS